MEIPNKSRGEHYSLRWNSYTNNLIQVLLEHQHHESLVDVTLCCEGQFIKAHKLVLSACSEVFQDMFKIHSVQHPVIILNGIKLNHFKHILEFMYQGEVKVLDVDLEGVLALGESLQVKGLSSIKFKQQIPSEELRPTPLKHNSNVTEYMPNSSSNSPALNNQGSLNSIYLHQPTKDFHPALQQQPKDFHLNIKSQPNNEIKSAIRKFDEHIRSGLKKAETSNINLNVKSNRNTKSKLDSILTDETETTQRKKFRQSEVHHSAAVSNGNVESRTNERASETEKNSRPANAFMIFANEWRRKLAVEHPDENNKEISVRLGNMWKSLSNETKQTYYFAAKKMELEHKPKYSECTPKPQVGKQRKMTRRKTIDSISHLASVNLQEFDDDDDLQIIEINEAPIDISKFPIKRFSYNKKTNT